MPLGNNGFSSMNPNNYSFNSNFNNSFSKPTPQMPDFNGPSNIRLPDPGNFQFSTPSISLPPISAPTPAPAAPKPAATIPPEYKKYFPPKIDNTPPTFQELINPPAPEPVMRNIPPAPIPPKSNYPFRPTPFGWWEALITEAETDPETRRILKKSLGQFIKMFSNDDDGFLGAVFNFYVDYIVTLEEIKIDKEIAAKKAQPVLVSTPTPECIEKFSSNIFKLGESYIKEACPELGMLESAASLLNSEKETKENHEEKAIQKFSKHAGDLQQVAQSSLQKGAQAVSSLMPGIDLCKEPMTEQAAKTVADNSSLPMRMLKKTAKVTYNVGCKSFELAKKAKNKACDVAQDPKVQGAAIVGAAFMCNIQ